MNNLFRKKQEVSRLLLSIIVVFVAVVLNACSIEAKSLEKGKVYCSLDRETWLYSIKGGCIEVISKNELEVTVDGKIILARYDFKGDKLRVVVNIKGTEMVVYYLLTEEGLKDEKSGEVYYSKASLKTTLVALEEKRKKEEEEKLKAKARKFRDNGNGTVTHNDTKLMWQQGEGGEMTWESALTYCKGLSLAGYNDWRLPNIEELKSIIDVEEEPTINKTHFPNTYADSYWSSTTYENLYSSAWFVYFKSGSYRSHDKSFNCYVRCVRGGQ